MKVHHGLAGGAAIDADVIAVGAILPADNGLASLIKLNEPQPLPAASSG